MAAKLAQMLLNDRLMELPEQRGKPFQPLVIDGVFGPKSENALISFFTRAYSVSRQPVIDAGVWRLLGLKVDIDHRVPLVGQPQGGLCWSSAAAMVLGGAMSVSPGGATFDKRGALAPDLSNLKQFGASLGWRLVSPTLNAVAFADLLRRRPVWIAGQGASANGQAYGHAIVVSGMWGDGDANGSTALLRIHDPWPTPRGRIFDTLFFSSVGIRLPGGIWFRPQAVLVPN
jgi:hypothetical protein